MIASALPLRLKGRMLRARQFQINEEAMTKRQLIQERNPDVAV
ncbi:hypothetical protein [Bradyrhizobium sp. CCBAU 21360]|nr:hypothetical protein [Bradyrhizobium sp. CCBAU 21360]